MEFPRGILLLLPSRRESLPLALTTRGRRAARRATDYVSAVVAPPVRRRIVHSDIRPARGMHPGLTQGRIAGSLATRILGSPFFAEIRRQRAAVGMIEPSRRCRCRLALPILRDALRHCTLHLGDAAVDRVRLLGVSRFPLRIRLE